MAPASRYSRQWMADVAGKAKQVYRDIPLACAVSVTMLFRFRRPRHHFSKDGVLLKAGADNLYHLRCPNLTKIVRSTEDALTGVIWEDDCQVVKQTNIKAYCLYGQDEGVVITVESFED